MQCHDTVSCGAQDPPRPREGCGVPRAWPSGSGGRGGEPVRLWAPTPTSTPAVVFLVFNVMGKSRLQRNVCSPVVHRIDAYSSKLFICLLRFSWHLCSESAGQYMAHVKLIAL